MTFSFFKSEISIFKREDLHSVKALDNISVLDKKWERLREKDSGFSSEGPVFNPVVLTC